MRLEFDQFHTMPCIANTDRQQTGLANAIVPHEVMRLRRAQKVAAEVRAKHPEMQVRKIENGGNQ